MQVKEKQVFNLMDTNGRRNDVINALQGYISILNDIVNNNKDKWGNIPNSLSQFTFYKRAIELSPDIFKQHKPYDELIEELKKYPELYKAVLSNDIDFIRNKQIDYEAILNKFDKGIEDRARHYTSNLVKLGFTDENRNISKTGELLLEPKKVKRDEIEKIFPIDNINIIYLRQLLKLKIFDNKKEIYYSPFYFALYILKQNSRISENIFFELIQGSNPYNIIENLSEYVKNYEEGDIVSNMQIEVPIEINSNDAIDYSIFKTLFTNQKSQSQITTYWDFYTKLYAFNKRRDSESLNILLTYYEEKQDVLKKAFGYGKNIFSNRRGNRPDAQDFIKKNKKLFDGNINVKIYQSFIKSKQLDSIHEYSDTTKRIFKATGIISFDNGYVELAYKELIDIILSKINIENKIWGNIIKELNPNYDCYEEYEGSVESYYSSTHSFCDIFELYEEEIQTILNEIKVEFKNNEIENIPVIINNKRKKEFTDYIETKYPIEKIEYLLQLFKDRTNDSILKDYVSSDATVPTIYEYIIGIAWYYFSGKKIDILSSFNLTLSANFEPLIHAGGGQGDIVIYEEDKVVMLEATLMNTNNQKRGEWEPVLRHSINLKIEEENNNTNRNVVTFFIADVFDHNTINIWKAVASVPLESTIYRDTYTDNVVIMPLNNDELIHLMHKSREYDSIIKQVKELFNAEKTEFNLNWRKEFITKII